MISYPRYHISIPSSEVFNCAASDVSLFFFTSFANTLHELNIKSKQALIGMSMSMSTVQCPSVHWTDWFVSLVCGALLEE